MEKIIGIGVDIEEVARFAKKNKESGFLKRIFTENELDYCFSKDDPSLHLAARFCAKEAVIKASPVKLDYRQVEVISGKGKPGIRVNKVGFKFQTRLSLAHSGNYSVAMVIVYR